MVSVAWSGCEFTGQRFVNSSVSIVTTRVNLPNRSVIHVPIVFSFPVGSRTPNAPCARIRTLRTVGAGRLAATPTTHSSSGSRTRIQQSTTPMRATGPYCVRARGDGVRYLDSAEHWPTRRPPPPTPQLPTLVPLPTVAPRCAIFRYSNVYRQVNVGYQCHRQVQRSQKTCWEGTNICWNRGQACTG